MSLYSEMKIVMWVGMRRTQRNPHLFIHSFFRAMFLASEARWEVQLEVECPPV